jgi:hypothetical protein
LPGKGIFAIVLFSPGVKVLYSRPDEMISIRPEPKIDIGIELA